MKEKRYENRKILLIKTYRHVDRRSVFVSLRMTQCERRIAFDVKLTEKTLKLIR